MGFFFRASSTVEVRKQRVHKLLLFDEFLRDLSEQVFYWGKILFMDDHHVDWCERHYTCSSCCICAEDDFFSEYHSLFTDSNEFPVAVKVPLDDLAEMIKLFQEDEFLSLLIVQIVW